MDQEIQQLQTASMLKVTDFVPMKRPNTINAQKFTLEQLSEFLFKTLNLDVAVLAAGFKGIAEPGDNPGAVTDPSFWIATTPGTYANFGGVIVPDSSLAFIAFDGDDFIVTSVEIDMTDYAKKNRDRFNLLYGATYKDGFFLSNDTEQAFGAFSYTTNAIPVKSGRTYLFSSGALFAGCRYDITGAFLGNITLTDGATNVNYVMPAGTAYIKANVAVAAQDTMTIQDTADALLFHIENLIVRSENIEPGLLLEKQKIDLLQGATYKNGFYLETDIENAFASFSYTENYIPIKPGMSYVFDIGASAKGCVYNENKVWISNIALVNGAINPNWVSPANGYFVRINIPITFQGVSFMKESAQLNGFTVENLMIDQKNVFTSIDPNKTNIYSRNKNTFTGAQNWVLDQLLAARPKARIMIVLHFSYDDQNQSRLWEKLVIRQKELAAYWCCPVVLMADNSSVINRNGRNNFKSTTAGSDSDGYMDDGLHPATDQSGDILENLTAIAYDTMLKIFNVWAGKKVAWYGTSIPAGFPYNYLPQQNNYSYANRAVVRLAATIQNYCVPNGVIREKRYDGTTLNNGRDVLSFTRTASAINYQNSMLDLIGTANEPDLYVFDYGVNDIDEDNREFYD